MQRNSRAGLGMNRRGARAVAIASMLVSINTLAATYDGEQWACINVGQEEFASAPNDGVGGERWLAVPRPVNVPDDKGLSVRFEAADSLGGKLNWRRGPLRFGTNLCLADRSKEGVSARLVLLPCNRFDRRQEWFVKFGWQSSESGELLAAIRSRDGRLLIKQQFDELFEPGRGDAPLASPPMAEYQHVVSYCASSLHEKCEQPGVRQAC